MADRQPLSHVYPYSHMKGSLLLSLLFFWLSGCCLNARAQQNGGSSLWSYELSYHNATQTLSTGNLTYALCNTNLLCYDAEDGSTRTFDLLSPGLSDKGITFFAYSPTVHCLVLLYSNNNIDLLYDDGSVANIPQVKNFTEYSISPNNLNVNGDFAAIATTEGVIVINLRKQEVTGAYRLMQRVETAVVMDNCILAATGTSIIRGYNKDNLYSPSSWHTVYTDVTARKFVASDKGLYMIVPYQDGVNNAYSGLCLVNNPTDETPSLVHLTSIDLYDGNANGAYVQFQGSQHFVTINPENPAAVQDDIHFSFSTNAACRNAQGTIFMAQMFEGLKAYRLEDGNLVETGERIGAFGPRFDRSYYLKSAGDYIYVAGGEPDYTNTRTPGFFGRLGNGQWWDMDYDTNVASMRYFTNICDMTVDPRDSSHVFAASYGQGLFEYKSGKYITNYNSGNSPLDNHRGVNANFDRYTRVGGCAYDDKGNLWISESGVDSVLHILKADGQWTKLYHNTIAQAVETGHIFFDSRGYLWMNQTAEGGLFCLDYKGTVDQQGDDRTFYVESAYNEDGNDCDLTYIKTVVEDNNGQIWIGANSGIYAITDPDDWFGNRGTVYQPKVPRNDGTNYADYLLTGIPVHAIAVDGGNRKWIGTRGGGIYLVSEDGSEVLNNFTTANSPLLSDNIYSLAFDHATGTLYIGTDLGLCTYRTGLTPAQAFLSKGNIKVYPNPVRPEYQGLVTIQGLTEEAEVKIVTSGQQLVYRGNSIGGTLQWDACSQASGRRCAPGVYYILVSTADGKDSVAAKLVII